MPLSVSRQALEPEPVSTLRSSNSTAALRTAGYSRSSAPQIFITGQDSSGGKCSRAKVSTCALGTGGFDAPPLSEGRAALDVFCLLFAIARYGLPITDADGILLPRPACFLGRYPDN